MNKKIIMSFLLILLITISASAVSAADADNQNAISSDSSDEIASEEIIKDADAKSLGEGVSTSENSWIVKPSSDGKNDALAIQKTIDNTNTKNGDTVLLNDRNFTLEKSVNISKDLTIKGGKIYNSKNLTDMFVIDCQADDSPKSISIVDSTFYVNGNENIVLMKGGTVNYANIISLADVSIKNCTIIPIDMDIDSDIQNTVLLNIESDKTIGETANSGGTIMILNNKLNDAKSFKNNDLVSSDNIVINKIETPTREILETSLVCENITVQTYDKTTNDTVNYYEVKLIDQNGDPVVNSTIQIGFNGRMYNRTTDENGSAKVKLTLAYTGTYTFASNFQRNEYYNSSFNVSTVTVVKKNCTVTAPAVSLKVNAKTKKLSATLKDKNSKAIANKKVKFTVNGKTYTGTSNAKGVASVTITLAKKGTYTYTAKFAGDNIYNSVSKKGKLTLNPLASALTVKKYTFKRYATKKIKLTLKSGSSLLKSKKVTVTVNGKTYSAKTNSKGVATVTIKLTKKGTFKYTAKFAGDNTYKATSKKATVVIK